MNTALDNEVDANFEIFQSRLPQIIDDYRGQFVLIRHEQFNDFFPDIRSAMDAGMRRFADKLFSIQEVTDRSADLGFFSHAVDPRIA